MATVSMCLVRTCCELRRKLLRRVCSSIGRSYCERERQWIHPSNQFGGECCTKLALLFESQLPGALNDHAVFQMV